MRVSPRRLQALAWWAASRDIIRVSECDPGDWVIDEKGYAWEYLGKGFFRLLKHGRPLRGTTTPFAMSRWVVRSPDDLRTEPGFRP